jgi:spore coat polysaccharide biosynthesis predicted glycosyltransferase SpsG
MRSSAIAEELIARGEEVVFIGKFSEVSWLAFRMNTLGFSQIHPEEAGFISNPREDILILDSYVIPANDEFIQVGKWKAIIIIADDITPIYSADLVIHPGLSPILEGYAGAKVLAGPRYIPLRNSIEKNTKVKGASPIVEILIVGGGSNTFHFVDSVCKELLVIPDKFHATIFTENENLRDLDSRLTIIPIGSQLDHYAKTADLVFTTASTTSLEFIAREVAVGIGCAVDNQKRTYESLSVLEVAAPIGSFLFGNWLIDREVVRDLVTSPDSRDSLVRNCRGLIDFEGVKRIVSEIYALGRLRD